MIQEIITFKKTNDFASDENFAGEERYDDKGFSCLENSLIENLNWMYMPMYST